MQQSYANNFSQESCLKELKKQDLFDLGISLTLAATGGLEMINEEFLAKLPNVQTTCCLIHTIRNFSAKSERPDKQVLTLIKVFGRLSEQCQDFICWCMQQRFSKNEMKKYAMEKVCTAADLRNHSWLSSMGAEQKDDAMAIKKKKSQFNLHNDGNVSVLLSLKELLNVSSDWMDVKGRGGGTGQGSLSTNTGGQGGSGIPPDFQSVQIEKIIDALALALPSAGRQIPGPQQPG